MKHPADVDEMARRAYAAARGAEPTTDTLDRMAGEIAAVLAVRSSGLSAGAPPETPDAIPTLDELSTDAEAVVAALEWEEAADGVSWRTIEEGLVGFAQSDATSVFLDELRTVALAASPGPWRVEGDRLVREPDAGDAQSAPDEVARVTAASPRQRERDAAFLAAFDPSMVLTLLFQNRQLEIENGRLRRAAERRDVERRDVERRDVERRDGPRGSPSSPL